MDAEALTYYKTIPKDFDGTLALVKVSESNLRSVQAEEKLLKPKYSVALKRVLTVDEIQEDDKKKFKKLNKAHSIAFKVTFSKKYLVKNKDYSPEEEDENQDEEEEDDYEGEESTDMGRTQMRKSNTSIRSKPKQGGVKKALTTWYFVCESKVQQEEWVKNLSLTNLDKETASPGKAAELPVLRRRKAP